MCSVCIRVALGGNCYTEDGTLVLSFRFRSIFFLADNPLSAVPPPPQSTAQEKLTAISSKLEGHSDN